MTPSDKETAKKREDHPMTLCEFSTWLKQQPPTGRNQEEIDAQIAEERGSWGDD